MTMIVFPRLLPWLLRLTLFWNLWWGSINAWSTQPFGDRYSRAVTQTSSRCLSASSSTSSSSSVSTSTSSSKTTTAKDSFLDALDRLDGFNVATRVRSQLLEVMTNENPTPKPGSTTSFAPLAVGTWSIVYAPHISMGGQWATLGGQFDPVLYILQPNGKMVSHARYDIPLLGLKGWLSVSGSYSSEDENQVCRVDFDRAWVRTIQDDIYAKTSIVNTTTKTSDQWYDHGPHESFEDVPNSLSKKIIQGLGQLGFVKSVSVFPVSYLDNNTIVFEFELLRTRICARKITGNGSEVA